MPEFTRRVELAAFLRARRERLHPTDVGLPDSTRRRVQGLRREEVAQLAGVGLTWYTWLEQGRPIKASDQVLGSIARALRLSDDECDHLFALAGVAPPERADHRSCVSPVHLAMLEKLAPFPAAVQNARFDILAYNRPYRFLFDDVDEIPVAERNCARLIFTNAGWQGIHEDLDEVQSRMSARLRSGFGRHFDEPTWQRFVTELSDESADFRRLWSRGEVNRQPDSVKRLRLPRLGPVTVQTVSLWLDETLESRMVWFAPLDDVSAIRLARLDAEHSGEAAITHISAA